MKEKTIGKNEIERNYILFGTKNSELINQNKPITLICNGKVYSDRVFNKQRHIIYANQEFYKEQMIELGDHLIFEINGTSNTVRITVLKQQRKSETNETNDIDKTKTMNNNETKPCLNKPNISKEEFLKLIEELRITFKENEWCFRASEENVRAELIDPILKALGWRMPYIRREFNNKDYILCNDKYLGDNSVKLIIEAKQYREQLLTDKKEDKNSEMNKVQIENYMNDKNKDEKIKHIQYGILTNGVRWCLFVNPQYTNPQYNGEIDIRDSNNNDAIWKFFEAFANRIDRNLMDNLRLEKNEKDDKKPEEIIIDFVNDENTFGINGFVPGEKKKIYKTRSGKETSHCNANYDVAKICTNKNKDLFALYFFRDIVSHNPPRTHKGDVIGDYGIYEKLTLLQEINSTLDLGLIITAE